MSGLGRIQDIPDQVIYSDVNLAAGLDNSYDLVYNELAVAQSLEAIWGTPYKSKPFVRRFGSGLDNLLFAPQTRPTVLLIEKEFKKQVAMWEDRISDFQVSAVPNYEEQSYYIEVSYKIPALNNKDVSYNFTLRRS